MDFDIITSRGVVRVMTTHRSDVDETPLQLISADRLAYFERLEAELIELRMKVASPPDSCTVATG